ncbi:hypothetical protein SADUNF_Sadunf16G0240700 [Salix dunnii]|uniref:DNA-directed RNA polymerase RpoA/D/Rpb3-type domain-containing protein n=1 Tax=Salix dunnii TaxID=1413687 RepID=A0A835JBW0_9ROSI|nr:hypothetical protein SADUNF_Sadunf16G0240700 [Salix dunnii]
MSEQESSSDEIMSSEEEEQQQKEGFSYWNLKDVERGQLPPHIRKQGARVHCKSDAPTNTETLQYSGSYASMGVDNSLRLDPFRENFRIKIIALDKDKMEFDMIGIDAAVANAFRRILISEVPTMAIEKVFIANNTSVIQDEVLAHRLGLIPIKVDPRLFEYLSANDTPNEKNTIVLKLHARCNQGQPRHTVYSQELKWLPNGSEFAKESEKPDSKLSTYTSFSCSQDSLPEFAGNPISTMEDIIVAKLGPGQIVLKAESDVWMMDLIHAVVVCGIKHDIDIGLLVLVRVLAVMSFLPDTRLQVQVLRCLVILQEIELEAHAVKGMGKTHAKWSPVGTAWYRMFPEVVLLDNIEGEDAEELMKKCPSGVFDIEDAGNGKKRTKVADSRACTLCRECIRGDEWEKRVSLHRVKDHFIFTIESTGALPPEALFTEAVKILEAKCERVITELS